MATSSKFDLSSDSTDRPLYTSGQRGSHLVASLDRSGSFRESMDNPILSSLPSMSRSSSAVTQVDMVNFFQCLRFDPKVVAADHKSNRHGDFKRHMNVALGLSGEDAPSGSLKSKLLPSPVPEEIKRVKTVLRESSVKARERVKIFNEALSVFNKFFPSVPSKKRSRTEVFANDRSTATLSSDRSVMGLTIGKMGVQNHAITNGFELEQQKSEERTKNAVPNKRTRTSMVDVRMDARSNALIRPSGAVERDREMLRLANIGAVQGDDRSLSIGVEGWEKSKMKKKRSGIKADVSPSMVSTKPIDGYRETKQGMHQRPVTDARSRINNDSHGFRQGVANGSVGVGKSDGISQQSGLGVRSSIPRTDLESCSLLNDKRDRPTGSEKERVNLRAVNKPNVRDDFNSSSPTSNTKGNASVRAPRSGSSVAPKLNPIVHRASGQNDWELSHCGNKPPAAVGANNRKRTPSTRSSSPPVAHWAGQRPQKIPRTARRTNFVPIVSSNDEIPALDTASDVAVSETGLGFSRRMSSNSPKQVKLKCDPLSSAALSESEESGATVIKSKDKGKKSEEMDEKSVQNVQKVSTLVLSSRKNKLVSSEDLGDGVRRQGRTGRGFSSTRALMPMNMEKLGNVGTAKQLRSARVGSDKTESKAGRPPTRKLSDRKAYKRQKHTVISGAADFLVGSDDGHEELLAAANAVINSAHSSSSSFWRQMEALFRNISDVDIAYLKQQGNLESTALTPTAVPSNSDGCCTIPNGYGLLEHAKEVAPAIETKNIKLLPDHLVQAVRVIPFSQRLIAALIPEEDCYSESEDSKFDAYGTGFELDGELESNGSNNVVNFQFAGHTAFNDFGKIGKLKHDEPEINMPSIPNAGINSSFGHSINGVLSDQALMPGMACSESQYNNMRIDEKIALEMHSIGIFPELVPDIAPMEDEVISDDICRLEEMYHGQVSKKKGLLDILLMSASETKEIEEKEFEQHALDKLVGMAYEKYMTCWGPNATGKSSSNKMAKQAALTFVKRTLDRCHKYEETGKSCFNEPLFRDMFYSGYSCVNGAQSVETPTDGESAKILTFNNSLEARITASMSSQPSSSLSSRLGQNGDTHAVNSSDLLPPMNRLSEQLSGKEDTWSNRVKKRELLLDDVVGSSICTSSSAPSGIGSSLTSSTKGKRSERDREGKGHSREVLSRNGTNKIGRPAVSNAKGERKSKTKPKQKTTQLSVSVNGLLGKMSEQPKPTLPCVSKTSEMTTSSSAKEKDELGLDAFDDSEAFDFSSLPEWLNIDDDNLQDHDFAGLEIPMDDLSDLHMMV
ncbi:hypothetical protein CFOL_v3_16470 [Cephalotus follicularis]|uniref:Uncharacterized protein n=1 Tax=Cephalotus follicularis TaxID=3775 RepID=A0A1Q3BYL7_CEPFO|nr:hypothetical protein CFOL_v3_16470 [Cephalotus follicularis]